MGEESARQKEGERIKENPRNKDRKESFCFPETLWEKEAVNPISPIHHDPLA